MTRVNISTERAAAPADHPEPDDGPLRSIVLCAVPGAGEEVVADLLRRAGGGTPRAYFDTETVAPRLLAEWEVTHLDEYVAALHRHCTTPEGVFGLVLHWHELRHLHRRVAGARQSTPGRLLEIVLAIAPEPVFVRVQRTDRARHVRALDARLHAARSAPSAAPLSAAEERRVGALLDATDAVWTQWFEAIEVQPIEVVYEQVSDDPRAQRELATHLGLPQAPAPAVSRSGR